MCGFDIDWVTQLMIHQDRGEKKKEEEEEGIIIDQTSQWRVRAGIIDPFKRAETRSSSGEGENYQEG